MPRILAGWQTADNSLPKVLIRWQQLHFLLLSIRKAIFQLGQFICFEIMSFIVLAKLNKRRIISDDYNDDGRTRPCKHLAIGGELFHIDPSIRQSYDLQMRLMASQPTIRSIAVCALCVAR